MFDVLFCLLLVLIFVVVVFFVDESVVLNDSLYDVVEVEIVELDFLLGFEFFVLVLVFDLLFFVFVLLGVLVLVLLFSLDWNFVVIFDLFI